MKNSQDSPKNVNNSQLRQKLLLVLCVVAMIPLFFAAKSVFSAFAQTKDKKEKVVKKYSFKNEPIEFLQLESDGKTIKADEKFVREDEWLKDLTIKFKNISGKPITYVEVVLLFPETGPNGLPVSHPLKYGVHPPAKKNSDGTPSSLAPNGLAELKLSSESFKAMKNFLLSRSLLSDLSEVNFRIMGVYFEDGTKWSTGTYWVPDPSREGKFIPDTKSQKEEK